VGPRRGTVTNKPGGPFSKFLGAGALAVFCWHHLKVTNTAVGTMAVWHFLVGVIFLFAVIDLVIGGVDDFVN
jgi:hypothetical protein